MARSKSMELDGDNVSLSPDTSRQTEYKDDTQDIAREENSDTTDESFDLQDNFKLDDEIDYVESVDDVVMDSAADITDNIQDVTDEKSMGDVQEELLSGDNDISALTDVGDLLSENYAQEPTEESAPDISAYMDSLSDTNNDTLNDILNESGLMESSLDAEVGDVKDASYEDAGTDIEEVEKPDGSSLDPMDLSDNTELTDPLADNEAVINADISEDGQSLGADYFETDNSNFDISADLDQFAEGMYSDGLESDIENLSLSEADETIERAQHDDVAMPDVTDMQFTAGADVDIPDSITDAAAENNIENDLTYDTALSDAASDTSMDMLSQDDLTNNDITLPEVGPAEVDTSALNEYEDIQSPDIESEEPIMDMLDTYMADETPSTEPDSINDILDDYVNNELLNDNNFNDIASPDVEISVDNPLNDDASKTDIENSASSGNDMNYQDAIDIPQDDLSIADTLDSYFGDVANDVTALADVDVMNGLDDQSLDNIIPDAAIDNLNDFEEEYDDFNDASYDSYMD